METNNFGLILRQLREQAGLSQSELADKVRINSTYLSKIENGTKPPPREKKILKLAEVLGVDKDELMTLAGKIPSDIAQILKNPEAMHFLTSGGTLKKIGPSNNTESFGTKLRELREQAGLSQREVANRVGINFSYLSKIESGAISAPSEQVLLRLAEVLDTNTDELMILAGKIPPDIAQILKNPTALQFLRSGQIQKKMEGMNRDRGNRTGAMRNLVNDKRFSRVVVSIVLVCAVAILLWFASPVTETAIAANNRGINYNTEGEYNKAIAAFNKAIEIDVNFSIAYSNRAWAYLKLGEYEQAITDCDKAIELDPSRASAYNIRCWAYNELGEYEQAIADCNRAIELDPSLKK